MVLCSHEKYHFQDSCETNWCTLTNYSIIYKWAPSCGIFIISISQFITIKARFFEEIWHRVSHAHSTSTERSKHISSLIQPPAPTTAPNWQSKKRACIRLLGIRPSHAHQQSAERASPSPLEERYAVSFSPISTILINSTTMGDG